MGKVLDKILGKVCRNTEKKSDRRRDFLMERRGLCTRRQERPNRQTALVATTNYWLAETPPKAFPAPELAQLCPILNNEHFHFSPILVIHKVNSSSVKVLDHNG